MGRKASGTQDDIVIVAGEVSTFGVLHLDDARAEVGHTRVHMGAETACSKATIVMPAAARSCSACDSHDHAAVDRQHLAGDVRRGIGGQEANAPATSSAGAHRFNGMRCIMLAANFSLVRMVSVMGVAASGANAFTRMFLVANSRASDLVNPMIPALAAE